MAKATFIHDGCSIDYTPAAGEDLAVGDVVVLNELVAVARRPIPGGMVGGLAVVGVFDFTKATGEGTAIAVGMDIYWNAEKAVATTDASGGKRIGRSVAAASDESATVRVRLQQ